jgi:hypothetical protein
MPNNEDFQIRKLLFSKVTELARPLAFGDLDSTYTWYSDEENSYCQLQTGYTSCDIRINSPATS